MLRMSQVSRDQAIGMLMTGATQDDVAKRFRVAPSTISHLQRRFQGNGVTRDRPLPGQPHVTTQAQDCYIHTTHLRDWFRAVAQTAAETRGRTRPQVCPRTVSRRLREEGIRPYHARVGVMLDQRRRRIRLEWARIHSNRNRDWRNARWRDVIFSDESRFLLFRHDGRRRVYRRRGERNAAQCVVQQDCFGGGGVMVWGAILGHGWRSALVFLEGALKARRYIDLILRNHVVPYVSSAIYRPDSTQPCGTLRNLQPWGAVYAR